MAAHTTAPNHFVESCPKLYLQDIERKDLLKSSVFLRDEKNQAPRSVYNKFENVVTFLKANGNRGLVARMIGRVTFSGLPESVAERAKLDADNFWLHKFRATFATRCLWARGDPRTVGAKMCVGSYGQPPRV